VDGDPATVGAIAAALGEADIEIVTAYRGEAALPRLADERPDAAIVAMSLPDSPGLELVSRIRARSDLPVLVLAEGREESVVAAIAAGASDVLALPVRPLELVARVQLALRREAGPPVPGADESFDGLRVDMRRREATVEGHPIQLTPTELELLAVLVARRGEVVDHRTLLRAGWPAGADADHETLRSHLGHLNAKLVAAGHPGLRNVRGNGYALRVIGAGSA
jgi:two-component system KDP operon response regulator KdpE